MSSSEKIAIAAHLHVLLRRKTGRVTDTEWLASNAEYATEIIFFARANAKADGHADLGEWADKLETAMAVAPPARPIGARLFGAKSDLPGAPPPAADAPAHRYVRGIR